MTIKSIYIWFKFIYFQLKLVSTDLYFQVKLLSIDHLQNLDFTCLPADCCSSLASIITIQLKINIGLAQSRHYYYLTECNLFLPWYSWNIAHLALRHAVLKTKTGWFGISVMCPSGAKCLHTDRCFSELIL